jgi:hypothetical protein
MGAGSFSRHTWKQQHIPNISSYKMLTRLSALSARAVVSPQILSSSFATEASTKPFVLINKHTKVICQGITGTQVRIFSIAPQHSIQFPSLLSSIDPPSSFIQ